MSERISLKELERKAWRSFFQDGLWDIYNDFHMGNTGELVAEKYEITRAMQDEYALNSQKKAAAAIASGKFKWEIIPVTVPQRKRDPIVFETDEGPRGDSTLEGLAKLNSMVDIPIAGHSRHIGFDTGAAAGLTMTEKIWSEVSPGLQLVKEENSRMATPLAGLVPCRRVTVELLMLGSISVHGAQVNVTANNNPFGQDNFTLGMDFFKETVIVLDFESKLLWIRNPTKSAISPTNP